MLLSYIKKLVMLCFIPIITNCATTANHNPDTVSNYRLQERLITSTPFDHKVFYNRVTNGDYLHVYIAGDGWPWKYRFFISSNPTSKNSLALHLTGMDARPALYLGRPCYHQLHKSRHCNSQYWTGARYSEEVVSSMVKALKPLLQQHPDKKVLLFGFSGGGTLVMLMARQLPQVTAVVTVVGNLNTDLWTKQHRYSSMKSSLNPFDQASLPQHIQQFHLVGGKDTNITRSIAQSYVDKHGGEIWEYPSFTHNCCWRKEWPSIVKNVHKKLRRQ